MRVRFKGEADGLPCHVYGQEFPVGEWVEVEGLATKLAKNYMFDNDGEPEDRFDHDGDGSSGGSRKPEGDLTELRAAYVAAVGKKPFPGWDAETLQARINAASPAEPGAEPEADPEETDA